MRFIQVEQRSHRMFAEGEGKGGAWKLVEGLKSHMDRGRLLKLGRFHIKRLTRQHANVIDSIEQGDTARAVSPIRTRSRELQCDLPEGFRPTRKFSKLRPQ